MFAREPKPCCIFACRHLKQPSPPVTAWIALTQVCQRWRKTALEYSALWSHIVIGRQPCSWTQVLLERSARVPIKIEAQEGWGSTNPGLALVAKAFAHPGGLRALCAATKTSDEKEALIRRLERPAPALQELQLVVLPRDFGDDVETSVLSSEYLAGCATGLRRLSLKGWRLQTWNSELLSDGLTKLVPRESG